MGPGTMYHAKLKIAHCALLIVVIVACKIEPVRQSITPLDQICSCPSAGASIGRFRGRPLIIWGGW